MFNRSNNYVAIWLYGIVMLVLLVLMTGGVTRLTHSGLSITEWKPIMGAIPPLNEVEWHQTFDKYKETPEYLKKNLGMTLDDFKSIFFWEFIHRLLARSIGLWLIIGWVFFNVKKVLTKRDNFLILTLFLLGGGQGLLGWYMVKSGLVDRPSVSHFRLAAHLSLALIVIGFTLFVVNLRNKDLTKYSAWPFHKIIGISFLSLLFITIVYGAFTAGLKAGFMFNTFPLMNGELFPSFIFSNISFFQILNDHGTIQFIHRMLGISTFLMASYFAYNLFKVESLKKRAILIFLITLIQVSAGVLVILLHVPLHLAVFHQMVAAILYIITSDSLFKMVLAETK